MLAIVHPEFEPLKHAFPDFADQLVPYEPQLVAVSSAECEWSFSGLKRGSRSYLRSTLTVQTMVTDVAIVNY